MRKAKIVKIEKKTIVTKDKKSFDKITLTFEYVDENKTVKKVSGDFGYDFVKKYFTQAGLSSKEALYHDCLIEVVTKQFEKDDKQIKYNTVARFNLLNEEGKAVYYKTDSVKSELDF